MSGCDDHKFFVNDMVNVLVEVQHVHGDFPLVHLSGRVAEVETDPNGNTRLRVAVQNIPPRELEDGEAFSCWFRAESFLNCDINHPEVFLRDYSERA